MKITKPNLVMLFILLFNTLVQVCAQEQAMLKGQVIDVETGEPVSYASAEIISKHIGAAANAGGVLQIAISESMMDESVTFSALAFYTRQLTVKELLENQPFVVELERKVYTLPGFTFRIGNLDKVKLGNFQEASLTSSSVTVAGQLSAVFMDNSDGCEGVITSVSYFIVKRNRLMKSYPRTPFRVRIFAVDSLTGGPGEDLLTGGLVVRAKGPGWFTVDVSEYNIKAPKEGYFAAMEWVYSKEKYYYNIIAGGEPRLVYGQTLGIILGNFTPNTWEKKLGYDWYFENEKNTGLVKGGHTNALINSEVDCFK